MISDTMFQKPATVPAIKTHLHLFPIWQNNERLAGPIGASAKRGQGQPQIRGRGFQQGPDAINEIRSFVLFCV